MSSVSSTRTSSTSFPSPTQNQGGDNRNTPGSFYRNLFYILIGLLAAFGLISFLSLLRARRRRRQIMGEAARLGVLVPGVPGYIPIRERHAMNWTRADGSENPDWWEVEGKKPLGDRSSFDRPGFPATRQYQHFELDFQPLAVIPPANRNNPSEQPIPRSELPFFPNHLAYRPESLLPPPSRFSGAQPESLDQLEGESVEVLTIIKMPSKDWPESRPVDETEEVVKEWAAMEIGIARLDVTTGR